MADGIFDPSRLATRDLRRLVFEIWEDARCDPLAAPVLEQAVARDAKSLDRAVLSAYLRYFPTEHPSFDALAGASALTARRRDWPWRRRGEEWQLWDKKAGPARIAEALLTRPDATDVLRDAGLDGDLAQGEFVAEAVEAACVRTGGTRGGQAETLGTRLIDLIAKLSIGGIDAMLVWALLAPWQQGKPSRPHERLITSLLSHRIGDPRLAQGKWLAIEDELRIAGLNLAISPAAILRRWLTEATVRAFFTIVRGTTDRKDQWDEREAFWLGYLDIEVISEAWFAFGRRAEQQAGRLAKEEDVQFGRVSGGADPSHSALLMTIGDMRVAEWSHDGACRLWPDYRNMTANARTGAMRAPELYEAEYDGNRLRTMTGPKGFERLSHHSGWQGKFARAIHHRTGIAHPHWGRG